MKVCAKSLKAFTTVYSREAKKGELFELRVDLVSDRKDKKKDAVKKVCHFFSSYDIFTKTVSYDIFRSLHR